MFSTTSLYNKFSCFLSLFFCNWEKKPIFFSQNRFNCRLQLLTTILRCMRKEESSVLVILLFYRFCREAFEGYSEGATSPQVCRHVAQQCVQIRCHRRVDRVHRWLVPGLPLRAPWFACVRLHELFDLVLFVEIRCVAIWLNMPVIVHVPQVVESRCP